MTGKQQKSTPANVANSNNTAGKTAGQGTDSKVTNTGDLGANSVGVWVKITTRDDKVYEGVIYAYAMGCVVLQSLPNGNPQTTAAPAVPPAVTQQNGPIEQTDADPPTDAPASSSKKSSSKPSAPAPLSFAAAAARGGKPAASSSQSTSSANGTSNIPPESPASAKASSPAPSAANQAYPEKPDFHILQKNFIKDISFEPAGGNVVSADVLVPVVASLPPEKLAAREAQAVRAEQEKAAKIGVGVSSEAQQLFDAISKTYPTLWRGKDIVIMDEVIISAPYTLEDIKVVAGKGTDGQLVSRIKKIYQQHERLRGGSVQ
ncbi:hypothetical protein HK097_000297 [Rhizophlyctis rosea]|uniref:AD domain-containing protein n=1 Tax=Rhizophlyctis rosea TaxID=64517 RepID=A0AAD5SHX7_9FUNG|nr:hypothetical protein HK097_000297 [Rhizophlyctis rosea]